MPSAKLEPKRPPERIVLRGQYTALEPINPDQHSAGFDQHLCGASNASLWDYIPFGAPKDGAHLFRLFAEMERERGWMTFALRDLKRDEVTGTLSFMRIRPEHGSAEVGCVVFGKALQRTRPATEAIYLMAQYLFQSLDYRRFEWKCNNRNEASRRAAARFGFPFEGVFRNDMIVKGESRDTAWFAMTNEDWARLKPGYAAWLSAENFDLEGQQRAPLRFENSTDSISQL